jgi:outer membrane immunogenic protein
MCWVLQGGVMNKALVFTAIALPVVALGSLSQPSVATAQSVGPSNWSGVSATVEAGGAWGSSGQHDGFTGGITGFTGPTDGHYDISGALGGAGVGYNWQSGNWVAGLSADISGGNVRGASQTCGGGPDLCGTKLNELGTVRGLFGYAFGQYLLFGSVGGAWGHINAFDSSSGVTGSKIVPGIAFGGGLDVMLNKQLSFKVEYVRVDFRKSDIIDVIPGFPEQVSTNVNVVRAGLTYYFAR